MPDIALLDKPLTPGASVGIDTLDPRFQEIAALAEQAEYTQAADKTEELLREDIYDIRLIGYFLYGTFLRDGLKGLGKVMEVATKLFGESWNAVGPAKKKENHAQNGLAWFFQRLIERLTWAEDKKGDDWNRWLKDVSSDDAQAILDQIDAFRKGLGQAIPAGAP